MKVAGPGRGELDSARLTCCWRARNFLVALHVPVRCD